MTDTIAQWQADVSARIPDALHPAVDALVETVTQRVLARLGVVPAFDGVAIMTSLVDGITAGDRLKAAAQSQAAVAETPGGDAT